MPNAPLMSKIRCHNPNQKRSSNRNRNYLVYIATREGVDLSLTKYDLEKEFSAEIPTYAENEKYLKYIAERPRSNGLFGNIDTSNPNLLGSKMYDMTKEGKIIYRGIISLKEVDAVALGYDSKEKWIDYMKSVMPDLANQFKIPIDKLEWTGAVHMEKGHPHVHYMFWRSDDKVHSSFIHPSVQDKCRELLSKEMFKEEREIEILNKTMARDFLIELGKDITDELTDELKDFYVPGEKKIILPDKLKNKELDELSKDLLYIMDMLPKKGRINYKLVSPEIKEYVDQVTEKLFKRVDFKKEINKYMESVENISKTYSVVGKKAEWNKENAYNDIKNRIGNIILTSSKDLRKDISTLNYNMDKQERAEEYKKQHQEELITGTAYTCFRNAFDSIVNSNKYSSSWNVDKKFRNRSKQATKEEAKKQRIQGGKYDKELENNFD